MGIGHPDFADVRRHFFGRTILSTFGTLAANGNAQFLVLETDIDDVAIVRVICDQGVNCKVGSLGQSGDTSEAWNLGLANMGWGRARRIVVQPQGGGIYIRFKETLGAANRTYVVQVDTYIGADQNQMQIRHDGANFGPTIVGAGALSFALQLPNVQLFDQVSMWVAASAANCWILPAITSCADDGGTAMAEYQGVPLQTTAAGTPVQTTLPTAGVGMRFYFYNNTGVAQTIDGGFRAYRLG